jgi:hypothetical protein
MNEFIKLYDDKSYERGWSLEIYHSSIMDWCITVGYKVTHPKHGETLIRVQNCDVEFAFAKAQVELKEWLSEHEGGY